MGARRPAAAAAVAPDIKVLKGRVVSGDQFVSPAGQKERILTQAAYLNGVRLVVVRAISDKHCAEGPFQSEVSSRSVEHRP